MLKHGTFVIGEFVGFESEPWASDATKFNNRIGVKTGSYPAGFGETKDEIISIDIFDDETIRWVIAQQDKLKGKDVICNVIHRAKGGRSGAWLSRFMPRGQLPQLLSKSDKTSLSGES